MPQSEHNKYVPGYAASQVKHHEWRTVDNSATYLLPHLRALRDAKPQLTILDVGAGSGTISVGFAREVPDGQVIATDLSGEILERARGFARDAGQLRNMRFEPADVYRLPFPDGAFDLVHCHQMLCHLDDPPAALREMMRVARPAGGIVAARESDLEMQCVWPPLPGVLRFNDLTRKTVDAAGGCSTGGRQLVSWALRAGATRAQITAGYGTWCYSAPEDRKLWGKLVRRKV
jgi:SAM-dependent methyltransferase